MATANETVDASVLKKYEISKKLGKGVRHLQAISVVPSLHNFLLGLWYCLACH